MYLRIGFEVLAVEAFLESAITNNIPVEVAKKQGMTPDGMFTEWLEKIRVHVSEPCEFTIAADFCPTVSVRDWYGLRQLVTEIHPAICTRNKQWIESLIDYDERP